MTWRRTVVLLAMLWFAVPSGPARAQTPPTKPPLLGLPTFGFNPCALPTRTYVFTNEADWLRFWSSGSSRPAPRVDFAQWQVVAVALGARPNPGYAVHFLDYRCQGEDLVVRYEEWVPGPGVVWRPELTYPLDLAAIPVRKPVRFERTVGPHQGVLSPVPREVPTRTVELAALSPCTPEQFAAFATPEAWQQFWCEYGQGPAPKVSFERGYTIVGVVGVADGEGVSVSEVKRAGDRITVTIGPSDLASPGGRGQRSVLLVVPPSPRVDFYRPVLCR